MLMRDGCLFFSIISENGTPFHKMFHIEVFQDLNESTWWNLTWRFSKLLTSDSRPSPSRSIISL